MNAQPAYQPCSDCSRDTADDDMAPSCGAHILCVSCYLTSDFRCRECARVVRDLEDGAA